MVSISIPITVNLPDDWAEQIADRLRKNGDVVLVTRCQECKFWLPSASGKCGYFNILTCNDDYCSSAERKEEVSS